MALSGQMDAQGAAGVAEGRGTDRDLDLGAHPN